ncbi:MAG: nitrous oxide-stimulated promoter family protein [Candidatus Hinthialibacter sp.]
MVHPKRTNSSEPRSVEKNRKILEEFVHIYCRNHHSRHTEHNSENDLCEECVDLLDYARRRLLACPYDPKPKCKHCPTHCYRPHYREKMKAIMRYSGMYFVKRGRIDWLFQYFFTR